MRIVCLCMTVSYMSLTIHWAVVVATFYSTEGFHQYCTLHLKGVTPTPSGKELHSRLSAGENLLTLKCHMLIKLLSTHEQEFIVLQNCGLLKCCIVNSWMCDLIQGSWHYTMHWNLAYTFAYLFWAIFYCNCFYDYCSSVLHFK